MADVTSDPKYLKWIEDYVQSEDGHVRGLCGEASSKMVAAFPELKKVCGFVYCGWGKNEHWWCVAPDGTIVDPTWQQFDFIFEYEQLDLNNPDDIARIPIGRCMECGERTYQKSHSRDFCSSACYSSFAASL